MSVIQTGKTVADSVYAYRFIRLMLKSFSEWDAYKLGLIDERGGVLRRPKTDDEKKAYTPFHAAIRSFKRTMQTVPGAAGLTSMAASLSAISSRFGLTESDISLIAKELNNPIFEAVVSGDAGGDPVDIASGQTSGAVTNLCPVQGKQKKRRKLIIQNA